MEEEISRNVMAQALLGDSSMLSAVASLLRKHNGSQEKSANMSSPMLVRSRIQGKDSFCSDLVLGSSTGLKMRPGDFPTLETNSLLTRFEEVHALATANLVVSTQQEIAQQLAEEVHKEYKSVINQPAETSVSDQPYLSSAGKLQKKTSISTANNQEKMKPIYLCKQLPRNTGFDSKKKCELKESNKTTSDSLQASALTCSFEGCHRKFAWQNHLKYHEMTHTNNRQYKCPFSSCSKSFFTAQRLEVHLRTHTGERPFTCTHPGCGKSFTTAGNLKNHERIHTGERPFSCDFPNCSRSFAEQSSLKKHKRRHTGAKPFLCDKCSQTFTQTSSLSKHMLRHLLDEEIHCSKKEIPETNKLGEEESEFREKSSLSQQVTQSSPTCEEITSSPQVIVLNNSYQGVQENPVNNKPEELLLLSGTQVFGTAGATGNLVYGSDILNHEEVPSSSYVTTPDDYTEISGDDYMQEEVTSNYAHTEVTNDYTQADIMADYQGEVTVVSTDYTHQSDLIEAEEVTVSTSFTSTNSHLPLPSTVCNNQNEQEHNSCHTSKVEKFNTNTSLPQFISKIVNAEKTCGAECCNPDSLGGSLAGRGMYMDPMMQWDEEPGDK